MLAKIGHSERKNGGLSNEMSKEGVNRREKVRVKQEKG